MKTKKDRRQQWWRVLEALVLVGLIVSAVVLYRVVQHKRGQVEALRQAVERAPELTLRQAEVLDELATHRATVGAIYQLVPALDEMPAVVGQIEQVARVSGVSVEVPTIAEAERFGSNGQPLPWTGPVREVRLAVRAKGEPVKLLHFLHLAERLPLLVRVGDFRLKMGKETARGMVAPSPAPVLVPSSTLELSLILTIRNDG